MAGSSSKQYFKISQGTKYLTAASGRVVTLEAKKNEKGDFDATQLWEKKEAFFLVSKSKDKGALVEKKKDENRPVTIELRQTPTMDGLWTESDLGGGFIYIQKASDPKLVFDAKFALEDRPPNVVVVLEEKRRNPKETSRWKMEPWVREEHAATGASASRSPPTVGNPGSTSGGPRNTAAGATGASNSRSNK